VKTVPFEPSLPTATHNLAEGHDADRKAERL
jgi:hypothetical protein